MYNMSASVFVLGFGAYSYIFFYRSYTHAAISAMTVLVLTVEYMYV